MSSLIIFFFFPFSKPNISPLFAGSQLGFSYAPMLISLTRDFRLKVFFRNQCPPGPPLEPFWIFSKIRGNICELMFITGDKLFSGEQFIFPRCCWYRSEKKPKSLKFIASVNDNAEKLLTGVNDTVDKFFGGVSDTGDERVLPILACLHLKMKNKQNFNL